MGETVGTFKNQQALMPTKFSIFTKLTSQNTQSLKFNKTFKAVANGNS